MMDCVEELIALLEQSRVLREALRDGTFWENEAWVEDLFDETPISDSMTENEKKMNEGYSFTSFCCSKLVERQLHSSRLIRACSM